MLGGPFPLRRVPSYCGAERHGGEISQINIIAFIMHIFVDYWIHFISKFFLIESS
jgi:hypothetical protein